MHSTRLFAHHVESCERARVVARSVGRPGHRQRGVVGDLQRQFLEVIGGGARRVLNQRGGAEHDCQSDRDAKEGQWCVQDLTIPGRGPGVEVGVAHQPPARGGDESNNDGSGCRECGREEGRERVELPGHGPRGADLRAGRQAALLLVEDQDVLDRLAFGIDAGLDDGHRLAVGRHGDADNERLLSGLLVRRPR